MSGKCSRKVAKKITKRWGDIGSVEIQIKKLEKLSIHYLLDSATGFLVSDGVW